MQTSRLVEALVEDLRRAASVGDERAQEAAERLTEALESPLRLRLMEAMTEAATELTHLLPEGHVEVRLAGPDVEFVYTGTSEPEAVPDDSQDARITLRLQSGLKDRIEAAAAARGISVNTFIVRTLSKSVARRVPGNRLTGFAKS